MRRTLLHPTTVRRGFTLVELLVAAALSVLVMYILAEAFKAGTDTLSQLKSVAGLSEQLRSAETIIRRDLKEQHLEDKDGNAVLVSDPSVSGGWKAPDRGFFKVVQVSQGTNEQSDGNGIPSRRATDHWVQFTNKLSGKSTVDVFSAEAPSNSFNAAAYTAVAGNSFNMVNFATIGTTATNPTFVSQWGEVTYFLTSQANALMPPEAANPQPLFVLRRRSKVMAPPGTPAVSVTPANTITNGFSDLSGYTQDPTTPAWKMNTPNNMTDPQFRTGPPTTLPATITATSQAPGTSVFTTAPSAIADTNNFGSDILLANVVSMRIQVQSGATVGTTFTDLSYTDPTATSVWPAVWDTYLTNDAPSRIRGVRIQLRVYDTKNLVTRQVTIDQPL